MSSVLIMSLYQICSGCIWLNSYSAVFGLSGSTDSASGSVSTTNSSWDIKMSKCVSD